MLWWPKRGDMSDRDMSRSSVQWAVADRAVDGPSMEIALAGAGGVPRPVGVVEEITAERLADALDALEIRYIRDGDGAMLAMWERHAVLFTVEGPSDEILVIRARPHDTVPGDWAQRAYMVVNEWNHTRRFAKAYVGDPLDSGHLPIYAEVQVPLIAGLHDQLLIELIDCAVSVSECFVEWLHDEGALF